MKENYTYPALIVRNEGLYQIKFIDFPDMNIVEGNTMDEAIEYAQEVLALQIMDYEEMQKPLPEPSDIDSNAIFIHVWMPRFRNGTKVIYVKKNVTIPQWLDILAKENNVSYSAALVNGIKLALGMDITH